jgi:ribose 5-phosphate isomerase A
MNDTEHQKQIAGAAAAALVETGMTVGLGTGTTAVWLVKALGARVAAEGLKLRCVCTSQATATLAASLGLTLLELDEAMSIDLTIDGADEIGPGLSLIKGGGAALLREKLVWEASRRCVTIALRICDALAEADIGVAPRLRTKDGKPVITDNGNLLYDAPCGEIVDPALLADALKSVTGVVEHGLFLDLADEAIIGGPGGIERLTP